MVVEPTNLAQSIRMNVDSPPGSPFPPIHTRSQISSRFIIFPVKIPKHAQAAADSRPARHFGTQRCFAPSALAGSCEVVNWWTDRRTFRRVHLLSIASSLACACMHASLRFRISLDDSTSKRRAPSSEPSTPNQQR